MILKRLNILNFKNISSTELEFGSGINCFVGNNGTGKTNVLDAIYYLSMTKSALGLTDSQCVLRNTDFFMISAEYSDTDDYITKVVCSFKDKKNIKKDGKEYEKLRDHIGTFPIVFSSPSDISLISDAPEERRKFLNASISQDDKEYFNELIKYNRLIEERNRAIKGGVSFRNYIDILDLKLPDIANLIYRTRQDYINQISPVVSDIYNQISGGNEHIEISYESDLKHSSMQDLLHDNIEKDLILGYTTKGIHRDDIRMTIDGVPIKKYGSQGQQKTLLLALKLAQAELYNKSCGTILLLDDVFDKLDISRVQNLIKVVTDLNFGQIFITDCNKSRLENILHSANAKYKLFNVNNGNIQES